MQEFHSSFKYQYDDVIPAQRARFTRSTQTKTISILGIVATIVAVGQKIYEWRGGQEAIQWMAPVYVALIFMGVLLISYLLMPILDFYTNKDWKAEHDLSMDEVKLKIILPG